MELIALYDSPIGPITLTFDGEALTGLCFDVHDDNCVSPLNTKHSPLNTSIRWLDLYFSSRRPDFTPPLALRGTPFQLRVWQALMDIPYGETTTYGAIARSIGCRSAQAVGQAVGHNPIAIIVPCHRVVGSDGTLTGYAYGIEKKQYLLELEKQSLIP
ncbi:MAG: methylated-DNA--[Bacteroidales bacterium]|nr:methylated-DNA--[protein]-cysteine S-methyltransferase [Bacteroidales bacterium]